MPILTRSSTTTSLGHRARRHMVTKASVHSISNSMQSRLCGMKMHALMSKHTDRDTNMTAIEVDKVSSSNTARRHRQTYPREAKEEEEAICINNQPADQAEASVPAAATDVEVAGAAVAEMDVHIQQQRHEVVDISQRCATKRRRPILWENEGPNWSVDRPIACLHER